MCSGGGSSSGSGSGSEPDCCFGVVGSDPIRNFVCVCVLVDVADVVAVGVVIMSRRK